MRRLIHMGWGFFALFWTVTAYAMVKQSEAALSEGLAGISVASLLLALLLAAIGGLASMFQRLASADPPVRSIRLEIGSVIGASLVAGLAAFFIGDWQEWPAPLTALAITLASWGGKRALDSVLDAGLRRIQGG